MLRRAFLLFVVLPFAGIAQTPFDAAAGDLSWRGIGPDRGGRSVAVSGVKGRPAEFYMGTTGGGVWKSTDSGQNWRCVTDGFLKWGSVGAVAVSESNPDVVYVGMGECDIRGNISPGDGVYKSTDAGRTWTHMGLADTRFIGKVRIHPKNPDTVWVAALGHVYGPHPERGVYKSVDGGKTWKKTLYVDDRSGAISLTLDPSNADHLIAATWTAWRTPYSLNSGGEGSRLWQSKDGGETWKDIAVNPGLPIGLWGKVGVAFSPADPKRVYAIIEADQGGVYTSDDGGATWKAGNSNRNWRQRAWYYTHIIPDPKDKEKSFILNVAIGRGSDGGKTYSTMFARHPDNHDMWIDPDDPTRMIVANDGGATVSTDGGRTWSEQDFATAQFYHVSTDSDFPYRLLGAQQDNSTVRMKVRGGQGGLRGYEETAGGESGYVAAHPKNPDLVFGGSYGGYLSLFNHRTNESRDVNPWPDNPMGAGAADLEHRFQWTFPIVFSPHDANRLYTSSQYVLVSTNLGESWQKISPDLTRNDKSKMQSSGGPITKDNTSVEYYGTVFTLAESPRRRGLIWAGSDDGLVHVTTDGGKSWANVTPKELPEWGLCSMIEASPHDANVSYLAVDNHENDDHAPYAFVTSDLGKTWQRIDGGMPKDSFVRVVREDPVRRGLLYAGTETGVLISPDDGRTWRRMGRSLPVVPIHDLVVKENDLCAATHGRSFWVLENLTPLRQQAGAAATLYQPADAHRVRWGRSQSGVVLDYYLPKEVKTLDFEVFGPRGIVLPKDSGQSKSAGHHRVAKWLAMPGARVPSGILLWTGGGSSITVPPGEYTVRMTVDGVATERKFKWMRDPRSSSSDKDLWEQYEFATVVSKRADEANQAVVRIREHRKKVEDAVKAKPEQREAADAVLAKLRPIEEAIYQTKLQSGQDMLNYPIRLNDKLFGVLGTVLTGDYRPTRQAREVFDRLSRELQSELDRLAVLEKADLKPWLEAKTPTR
ncbi:MAG: hypothetical protein HONBIEJF_00411 [Fimbriimonadaceae bacterium]|nr:hypothetical protein [Fimbriimonadaceae bacterium]